MRRMHSNVCSLLTESRRQPFTSAPPICAKTFHNRSSAAKFPRATSISEQIYVIALIVRNCSFC